MSKKSIDWAHVANEVIEADPYICRVCGDILNEKEYINGWKLCGSHNGLGPPSFKEWDKICKELEE